MNNYCEQGNCECKFMEDTRRYAIDVPELYKRIDTATDQYNAVVTQNKNLQGELKLYKKMVELTLQFETEKAKSLASYDNLFQMYKSKALQELEAENE